MAIGRRSERWRAGSWGASDGQFQAAVVWTSSDGRAWELIESDAFRGGVVQDAATDGKRIVVTGDVDEVPVPLGVQDRRPALWITADGHTWEVVEPDGPVPDLLAWTVNGWIGVRNTETSGPGGWIVDGGPQFLASEDGVSWRVTTSPGDHGLGRVAELSVDLDGSTALAVGYHEVITGEGLLDSGSAVAWRTLDGSSWERAPDQESLSFGGPGGLYMHSVTASHEGWLAVGRADDVGPDGIGVWVSADGLAWNRMPAASSPTGQTVERVVWTDPGFAATGTIGGQAGSVIAAWVSADGTRWDPVRRQPALEDGSALTLLADGDLVIAAGARSSAPDHTLAVVYLTSR